MHKGSLGVTFFSVRPSVCPSVCKFWEIHFFLVNYNCDDSYDHLWCPNWPEVNRKWTGSGQKSGPEVDWKFIFLANYNCDASYEHLWCPKGPEVNQKWPEVERKWARSGLEVSICPSVRLFIPNTSLTSLTNLMRGIYKRRALAPCDFYFCNYP